MGARKHPLDIYRSREARPFGQARKPDRPASERVGRARPAPRGTPRSPGRLLLAGGSLVGLGLIAYTAGLLDWVGEGRWREVSRYPLSLWRHAAPETGGAQEAEEEARYTVVAASLLLKGSERDGTLGRFERERRKLESELDEFFPGCPVQIFVSEGGAGDAAYLCAGAAPNREDLAGLIDLLKTGQRFKDSYGSAKIAELPGG